ncbi:MAG: hypothetical protein U0N15_08610 [Bifidobacterium choerinum]
MPQQEIREIPLAKLRLWTENPRDPLDADISNEDIIEHALSADGEAHWQLRKLAKSMGNYYDYSELPTVVEDKASGMYTIYDGNRRVILALLQHKGFPLSGDQFTLPLFPDAIPCNVCSRKTALNSVMRKHGNGGTWKPFERDLFLHRYMDREKSVLVRMQDLVDAMDRWPNLNQGFVRSEILSDANLGKMGLDVQAWDYGVSSDVLVKLLEAISERLSTTLNTRVNRNDPLAVLPQELLTEIAEERAAHVSVSPEPEAKAESASSGDDQEHGSYDHGEPLLPLDDENGSGSAKTPSTGDNQGKGTPKPTRRSAERRNPDMPIFGGKLSLRPGKVNNIYLTLDDLWQLNLRGKVEHGEAFVAIFRMGLRLLAESAADDENLKLYQYVATYMPAVKATLRSRKDDGTDILTYLSAHSILDIEDVPDDGSGEATQPKKNYGKLIQLLQNGAHGYTSSNIREQAIGISIALGAMLQQSHGKQ